MNHSRLLILALGVALAGCSSKEEKYTTPDGEVTVDKGSNTVTVKSTKDGKTETVQVQEEGGEMKMVSNEGTLHVSEGKVPENFPLRVPAGATVQNAVHSKQSESGEEMFMLQFNAAGTPVELANDYEKQLKEKGLKVERVEQSGEGGPFLMLNAESEEIQAAVHVETEEGKSRVTINWTTKKP